MSKIKFFAAVLSVAFAAGHANAQSDASNVGDISSLPLASVESASYLAYASRFFALDASATAVDLIVRDVRLSGTAIQYVMERVTDGVRVTVEISGQGLGHSALAFGTPVSARVLGTGVVLSAAGQVLAFVPNALGRALLHNERIGS